MAIDSAQSEPLFGQSCIHKGMTLAKVYNQESKTALISKLLKQEVYAKQSHALLPGTLHGMVPSNTQLLYL